MSMLIDMLRSHARNQPNAIALRMTNTALVEITYARLLAKVEDVATELRNAGIKRLALHADNGLAWILIDLASRYADICLIPLPTFFSSAQIVHAIKKSDVDTILMQASDVATALQRFGDDIILEACCISGLSVARREPIGHVIRPEISKITFTSGSTGAPKGVQLTTENMDSVANAVVSALHDVELENHLCALPLSTLLENIAGVYVPLLRGSCCTILPLSEVGLNGSSHFDPEKLVDALQSSGSDSVILTPQLLKALLQFMRTTGKRLPEMNFVAVGGGKVARSLLTDALELGLPVYEGYGLSECGSVVSLNTPSFNREGTCGRPLSHITVQIENGEVIVRGNSFAGYLDDDVGDTSNSPVKTGDIGVLDEQGFLCITGRRKNLLISSFGRNISPEWIESELAGEPCIQQCFVFGDEQPHLGALIFATPATDDAELNGAVNRVNHRLPDYARIRVWHRIASPFSISNGMLTENLRPKRAAIAEHYADLIDALYKSAETYLN